MSRKEAADPSGRLRRRPWAAPAGRVSPAALLTLLVLGLAGILGALPLLSGAARWLVVPRGIAQCDLMVVPGGGARERIATAVGLLADGACGHVLFTGDRHPETLSGWEAEFERLNGDAVISAPFATHSTWGDARAALAAAREHGFGSLLVVTSPYHTRRAGWIFARVLEGTGVRFGVHPSDSFYMNERTWWRTRYGRRSVWGEYLKLWEGGLAADLLAAQAARTALPAGGP